MMGKTQFISKNILSFNKNIDQTKNFHTGTIKKIKRRKKKFKFYWISLKIQLYN